MRNILITSIDFLAKAVACICGIFVAVALPMALIAWDYEIFIASLRALGGLAASGFIVFLIEGVK